MRVALDKNKSKTRQWRHTSATARLSADGGLHPFPFVRRSYGDERARDDDAVRAWTVEVEFDFDPSAVAEYWLRHCQAFLVDTVEGEEVGVVDEVELDRTTGRAGALQVSAGWFGRRRLTLAAERVVVILPHERRVLVETTGSPPFVPLR